MAILQGFGDLLQLINYYFHACWVVFNYNTEVVVFVSVCTASTIKYWYKKLVKSTSHHFLYILNIQFWKLFAVQNSFLNKNYCHNLPYQSLISAEMFATIFWPLISISYYVNEERPCKKLAVLCIYIMICFCKMGS